MLAEAGFEASSCVFVGNMTDVLEFPFCHLWRRTPADGRGQEMEGSVR